MLVCALVSFSSQKLDAGFRHRRSLIAIYFAEVELVKQLLRKLVNSDQNTTPLSPEAIDTIVR